VTAPDPARRAAGGVGLVVEDVRQLQAALDRLAGRPEAAAR
jgi:hypothetical protein